jgi:secondary thiamine-phosphate synthase enzyme
MELQTERFTVESADRFEVRDVTAEVEAAVAATGATDGLVHVSMPHTSAALATNEYESKLVDDMVDAFKRLVPPDGGYYHDVDHIAAGEQPNAHAHLTAALIDQPVLFVLDDGDPRLGTWESVLCFELCGPRERRVDVTVLQ